MNKEVAELFRLIETSPKIVFFGGAGVSTESGIPDFRSAEGIFRKGVGKILPEVLISGDSFARDPEGFYSFYKDKMLFPKAKPNSTHRYFASLEKQGKCVSVVTQNIDGLHQAAGSKRVWELHGSAHRNFCTRCGKKFDMPYILNSEGVPHCDACQGIVKPDVVLYGEQLDGNVIEGAIGDISSCDLLIVAGTSLSVYPAASFLSYASEAKLVIVNKTPTPSDDRADLVIHAPLGEVFVEKD